MKNNIKALKTEDFNYDLPEELIAYTPLEKRDASRLMVIGNGQWLHSYYRDLPKHLPDHTRLVFNNTKVIAARLFFNNDQDKSIEIFLLEPLNGDYSSLHHKKSTTWKCLIGGSKKWKKELTLIKTIQHDHHLFDLHATYQGRIDDYFIVSFNWEKDYSFHEILLMAGNTPLPPYIKREATAQDTNRYQTIYAKTEGSVAAPTAGLHFTNELMHHLKENGTTISYVTLHVGAGTFKPVTASSIADHAMHKEFFEVGLSTIDELSTNITNVIPVGTTSLRTLESLYWIGLRSYHGLQEIETMNDLDQWEHFDLINHDTVSFQIVFSHLSCKMREKGMHILHGHTGICITPGYAFKVAKGLITNFHQPQSTLLFIISAFLGNGWKEIYEDAIQEKYRFLSYGDGMLIKL